MKFEDAPEQRRCDYWTGAYHTIQRLEQSPLFNKPQREVLMKKAGQIRAQLEELGIEFKDRAAVPKEDR